MNAFVAMIGYSLKAFARDRGAMFWGIAFPLILMGLIGLAFGRGDIRLRVSVVDEGNAALADPLLEALSKVEALRVVREPRDEALAHLAAGRRTLVIVIPRRGTTLEAHYDATRAENGRTALLIMQRFIAEANLRAAGAVPTLDIAVREVEGRSVSFFDFLLPGILAMTLAQTGLMNTSYVVATMRERLVLKRVMATPVSPLAFLGGLVGRFSAVNLVQAGVILIVATAFFGARLHGNPGQLALLVLVGAVTFFGVGFAISTVSRTPESANLLGSVVNFPMMFLAGTFWPREWMPDAIRPVIAYLPLSALVDAMRGVSAYGESLQAYLWPILYLLAWMAAAFALAVRRFRWE